METPKVYDYVNSLISLLAEPEDFKKCNFAILCEKYPINLKLNIFTARVLYVSLENGKQTLRFYPDKLKEYNLEYIMLTTNMRRIITVNFEEFFVNGDTEEQEYKDCIYYNYSIENTSKQTKTLIESLREKYELITPKLFVGKHQDLVLE